MIVFTATERTSGKVFAGTTRTSLDDHWGDLLTQSTQGASGEFFQWLRTAGAEAFKIEEWGYSDNPRELREILAEAVGELSATPIKPSKLATSKVVTASNKASNAVIAELEGLKAEFGGNTSAKESPAASLRHTKSTREAAEMNSIIAGIEMRRKSGRTTASKSLSGTKPVRSRKTAQKN